MKFTLEFRPWVGAIVAATAYLVGTGTSVAGVIAVENPTFDAPAWTAGTYGQAEGWETEYGTAGNSNLGGALGLVGFAGDGGRNSSASLLQTLTTSATPGATYQLTVLVGTQNDVTYDSHYLIELLAGGHVIASQSDYIHHGDGFIQVSLTVHNTGTGPLAIQLSQVGNGQTLFDNVSLSIVPEPSTLAMSGTALLCGLGYARRRTRKAATA